MAINPSTMHVALLAGGTSGEREISLASGEGAHKALLEAGFTVTQLDPASKEDLTTLVEGTFDVAFLCMHGKGGEDGTLQGMLEVLGIPYTGPGVWASATAMDKAKSKIFYERAGVPTPESVTLLRGQGASAQAMAFAESTGWPVVVKPGTEGSALGVEIVHTAEELESALTQAFDLDAEVLVERYISGMETTVAVLGNSEPFALPVIQIVPQNDFYDFEAKYAPGGSQHICPAPLSTDVTDYVQQLAISAHVALECTGMSRTDIIVEDSGKAWALETNTIPGMTPTSLLPDAAKAAGMSFPQLCVKLIEFALDEVERPTKG